MSTRFSEDVVPLTDLKVNPGRLVRQVVDTHRPVLLTSRGRGVAVLMSIDDFEKAEDEREFMRAVVAHLVPDADAADLSSDEVRRRLCLEVGMSAGSASDRKGAKHD